MAYGVTVRVIDKERYFEEVFSRASDATRLLHRVGQLMVDAARQSFDQQAFGGKAWPARAIPNVMGAVRDLQNGPYVKSTRFQDRPALMETGGLKASIGYTVLGRTAVRVGSHLPYAALHAVGGTSTLPVTTAVKENLKHFLRSDPSKRRSLGFLFHLDSVTTRVPARQFVGVTPLLGAQIRTSLKDFILQRGQFRRGM